MIKFKFAIMGVLLFTQSVLGADIIMHKGSEVTVPVNAEVGTVLEFPAAVQMSVPSKKYSIKQIVTDIDKKTHKAVNIRFFSVKPLQRGAIDVVTFVFPNMRSIKVRLMSQSGADKHHLFQFPNRRARSPWSDQSFLRDELDMMVMMLRDESGEGFDKKDIEQRIRVSGMEDIKITLVRKFQGKNLFGYVFKVLNTGKESVLINPAALNYDSPNKAAILQIDHERLEPCTKDNSSNPRSNSCLAVLRLVVKGDRYVLPASHHDLPFRVKRG